MDVEIVRISSRGQFVLPLSMRRRNRIGKGEKLMLVDSNGTIVVKAIRQMKENIEDEIYMMRRAAKGWKEIEKGNFKRMPTADFLKELSTW